MTLYIGLVQKDAGSAYGIAFPDLPGRFSAADEIDGLLREAHDAIASWAEDRALPLPSSIDAIRERCDVADELAQGAFPLAVPVEIATEAA